MAEGVGLLIEELTRLGIGEGYPASRLSKLTRDPDAVQTIRTIFKREPTYGSQREKAILERDHGIELTQYMTTMIMREKGLLIERAFTSIKVAHSKDCCL